MNTNEYNLIIIIYHKENSFNLITKNFISLKELKEKSKKEFKLSEIDLINIIFYLHDNNNTNKIEIRSDKDIIKNSYFTNDGDIKIDLNLEIKELKKQDNIINSPKSSIHLSKVNKDNISDYNNKINNINKINIINQINKESLQIISKKEKISLEEKKIMENTIIQVKDLENQIKEIKEKHNEEKAKYNKLEEEMKNRIEELQNENKNLYNIIEEIKTNLKEEILKEIEIKHTQEINKLNDIIYQLKEELNNKIEYINNEKNKNLINQVNQKNIISNEIIIYNIPPTKQNVKEYNNQNELSKNKNEINKIIINNKLE